MRALQFAETATYVFGDDGSQFWVGRRALQLAQPKAMGNESYIHGAAWLGPYTADLENPDIIMQQVVVGINCYHVEDIDNDPQGEYPYVAYRDATQLPGVLHVAELVENSLRKLGTDSEFSMQVASTAANPPSPTLRGAYREVLFQALITQSPYYPPCSRLSASDAGGGQVTLTWTNPAQRHDWVKPWLRYASGATPPADESAGTNIPLSASDTTTTETLGSGQWSFSLFGAYDKDWPSDSQDSYSSRTTVTVTLA
jgi:hypothetical protein